MPSPSTTAIPTSERPRRPANRDTSGCALRGTAPTAVRTARGYRSFSGTGPGPVRAIRLSGEISRTLHLYRLSRHPTVSFPPDAEGDPSVGATWPDAPSASRTYRTGDPRATSAGSRSTGPDDPGGAG